MSFSLTPSCLSVTCESVFIREENAKFASLYYVQFKSN